MTELSENVAVITGASSGIGHATALELAGQGYNLVLAARRKKVLQAVAAECEALGVQALAVVADMTDEAAIANLADSALKEFGHIDVWLNNAGVYITGKFEDTPMEDIRRLMDTNFFGYLYGSRLALRQFREQGYGNLINISSVNATAPQPYVGVYGASKAAIRGLDESLRMELRLDGLHKAIHVCTVMPAAIDTNLFQNAANYTGQQVRAVEPVYDTTYAAKQIVRLAAKPRREIIIGPAGRLMELQNAHLPRTYERHIAKFTHKDLLDKEPAADTKGNLYEPIEKNTGISGGWRHTRVRADHLNAGLGAGLVAAASLAGLGYYFFKHADGKHRLQHSLLHGK